MPPAEVGGDRQLGIRLRMEGLGTGQSLASRLERGQREEWTLIPAALGSHREPQAEVFTGSPDSSSGPEPRPPPDALEP